MRITLNLQYFQGEKTEKATPKKRRDAREKGQVVQSRDLASAVSLLAVILLLTWFPSFFIDEIYALYMMTMNSVKQVDSLHTMSSIMTIGSAVTLSFFKMVLPILGVALLIGISFSYAQVGFLFTVEPLKFKLDKLSPLKGFKKLFSIKSLVEMVKSILKATGVLLIAYQYVSSRQSELMSLLVLEIPVAINSLWSMVVGVVLRCAIFLFIVAAMDYAYKRWENERELRMSKQEVKEEYKQMEGDPYIRSKIKEKQRQMAMSRMMQEVPGADVVITNPTHYAVALKYERGVGNAPRVIAKGRDLIASNIKKIATENDVPIVENKPLAQALYVTVDIDQMIPPDLFEAVADVLAYVYKIKNRSL